MINVTYVNHAHSEVCGVHDLGKRHAQALDGQRLKVSYVEANSLSEFFRAVDHTHPEVVVVNYMPGIMPWVNANISSSDYATVGVLHNYGEDTVASVIDTHYRMFDFCLALDPGLFVAHDKLIITDRPIPAAVDPVDLPPLPRVGTFGFAFPHKNFQGVAREFAAMTSSGTFDLHMPEAYFNGANGRQLYTDDILAAVRAELGPGHRIRHTHGHLSPQALVARLAGNHVNCLFYVPGQHNAGRSSALDYLVAARRPILVSEASMFDHMSEGVNYWPETHLIDIFKDLGHYTERAEALYDWAATRIELQTTSHFDRIR